MRYVYPNDRVVSLGRDEIRTSATELTLDNLADEMHNAVTKHRSNRVEIEYLIQYFKGYQPYVLNREKLVREDVDNRITLNYASAATRDIIGYLLGKPIQYVPRKIEKAAGVEQLNDYLDFEDKGEGDFELAQFASICGTAYRGVFPDPEPDETPPFTLVTLDPRDTFCVYSSDPTMKEPLFAVCYHTETVDGIEYDAYTIYTKNKRIDFSVESGSSDFSAPKGLVELPHIIGRVPIVEYPNNQWRMGDWETALSLLDAINVTASDSVNDVEQFVNSLLAVLGAELSTEVVDNIKETGIINIFDAPPGAQVDVRYLASTLDPSTVSSLREYLESSMRVILGVPDRKTRGGGGSDTGDAVFMRDGWMDIDLVASNKELFIIAAERRSIATALSICHAKDELSNLSAMDVEIKFSRSKSSNLLTKSQSYVNLVQTETITPADALEMVDLTTDEQDVTSRGKAYWDEVSQSNTTVGLPNTTPSEGLSGDSMQGDEDDRAERTDQP